MTDAHPTITADQWLQAELIWDYHQMHHEPRPYPLGDPPRPASGVWVLGGVGTA